jgi:zinc transporter, ZIP family
MTWRDYLLMGIPAGVALAGGVLAALWQPSRRARSLVQHFAAGVVLAALAVEVIPEVAREHARPLVVMGAFGLGGLFMFGLKLWTERLEHTAKAAGRVGVDRGLLLATFIDVAVDGMVIGAGFAAGGETGPVLAIGLSVELLFLGLSLTSDKPGGLGIVGIGAALGATVFGGAVVGNLLLAGASHQILGGVMAAAAAALMYLVTEELLIEAHAEPETPASTLVIFGGFLAFWAIQLVFA